MRVEIYFYLNYGRHVRIIALFCVDKFMKESPESVKENFQVFKEKSSKY